MEIIKIVLSVFVCTGFWSFLTEVYRNNKDKQTPQDKMILAIGRDKLLTLAKKYIEQSYIPDDEYEAFDKLFEAYIGMNGNSTVKALGERALKLPLKDMTEVNE